MSRRREIEKDLWEVFKTVYCINETMPKTEKQTEVLNKIVDYIEANLSTRRKRQEKDDRIEKAHEFLSASEERKQELIKEEADAIAGRPKKRSKRQ